MFLDRSFRPTCNQSTSMRCCSYNNQLQAAMPEISSKTAKPTSWVNNLLSLLSLLVLVGGGLAFGESFGGIVWLLLKWILCVFAIVILLVASKAKPRNAGVQTFMHIAMFVTAFLVLMFD